MLRHLHHAGKQTRRVHGRFHIGLGLHLRKSTVDVWHESTKHNAHVLSRKHRELGCERNVRFEIVRDLCQETEHIIFHSACHATSASWNNAQIRGMHVHCHYAREKTSVHEHHY